jgi:hypothetical protein
MPRPDHASPPVRTDHTNAFANNTMRVRLPDIIQQTQDNNPDYPAAIRDALHALRDTIADGAPIPPLALPAPDHDDWHPQIAAYEGDTWHTTDWFFAEVYAYRQLIQAVRWWETGRDPFLPVKQAEDASADLWHMLDDALDQTGPLAERLNSLLHGALWGNRIDLSFKWALERGTAVADDDLLVDHSVRVVDHVLQGAGPVHLIADNYGRELAMDLVLLDALLDGVIDSAVLHIKFHPTFVSDATTADVHRFLHLMRDQSPAIRALGERLHTALEAGRLRLNPDPFWNSTHFLWDAPPRLTQLFAGARLVIVKGDLNYRRIVGDAIWPEGRPFAEAVRYFPAPMLALRALKSDPIAGLPVGLSARLDAIDADWHWNGQRGLLQSNLPG